MTSEFSTEATYSLVRLRENSTISGRSSLSISSMRSLRWATSAGSESRYESICARTPTTFSGSM